MRSSAKSYHQFWKKHHLVRSQVTTTPQKHVGIWAHSSRGRNNTRSPFTFIAFNAFTFLSLVRQSSLKTDIRHTVSKAPMVTQGSCAEAASDYTISFVIRLDYGNPSMNCTTHIVVDLPISQLSCFFIQLRTFFCELPSDTSHVLFYGPMRLSFFAT